MTSRSAATSRAARSANPASGWSVPGRARRAGQHFVADGGEREDVGGRAPLLAALAFGCDVGTADRAVEPMRSSAFATPMPVTCVSPGVTRMSRGCSAPWKIPACAALLSASAMWPMSRAAHAGIFHGALPCRDILVTPGETAWESLKRLRKARVLTHWL